MKALGIHMDGGLRWIPKGLHGTNSRYYKAEVICPECGEKRWVTKISWQYYRKQKREFTGICLACRRLTGYKSKKKEFPVKKSTGNFDTSRLIDDQKFLSNITSMGNFRKSGGTI